MHSFEMLRYFLILIGLSCTCVGAFRFTVHSGGGVINKITRLKDMNIGDEKLVYDKETNRLYEADLGNMEEEEFFLVDEETGKPLYLSKQEKERVFLDAIQCYYIKGKSSLPDQAFDRLREDLTWEGSKVVTLSRNETLFLNAVMAYNKGQPMISDAEFDELKRSLKLQGSLLAVDTEPKCYVDSGVCKVTWTRNELLRNTLYVPALLICTLLYIGLAFELEGGNLNPLVTLLFGLLPIFTAAQLITENVFFKDPVIASGPCPNCGYENKIFFGDVLGVEGDKGEAKVQCGNCKTQLTVIQSSLRVSTLLNKAQ